MRLLLVLLATSVLSTACSTRALRSNDDLWSGSTTSDAAAFMGYHGPLPAEKPQLR